jgi:hypothetical protein
MKMSYDATVALYRSCYMIYVADRSVAESNQLIFVPHQLHSPPPPHIIPLIHKLAAIAAIGHFIQ